MATRDNGGHRAGFVYILSNPAMPGMVKIGLTTNKAIQRAVDLSRATGVPTDFELAYDELVSDCRAVERNLHEHFATHRVSERREFFRIPVRQAIALQEQAKAYPVTPREEERVDILPQLETRCRRWLRSDLVGAYIIQNDGLVYLESVFQPHAGLNDRDISRLDLSFIYDGDKPDFQPSRPVIDNAQRFVELDTYTIHMVTELFNEEAHQYIEMRHKLQEDIPFTS